MLLPHEWDGVPQHVKSARRLTSWIKSQSWRSAPNHSFARNSGCVYFEVETMKLCLDLLHRGDNGIVTANVAMKPWHFFADGGERSKEAAIAPEAPESGRLSSDAS